MDRYGKGSVITLLLVFAITAAYGSPLVLANAPSVDAPIPWTSGNHTILNVTVHHDRAFPPGDTHYVNQVEVDIDGVPHFVNLTNSPQQPPLLFVVQYDMGVVTGTPTVQTRAHCTYHFWGILSPSVQVPEFSAIQVLLILAAISAALVRLQYRRYTSEKKALRTTEILHCQRV